VVSLPQACRRLAAEECDGRGVKAVADGLVHGRKGRPVRRVASDDERIVVMPENVLLLG